MIFEGNVKYFSGLFLLAWPTKRQHGIQHHSSDFTAGLHVKQTLCGLFKLSHMIGGHMFLPQQRRNAPARLLPPLWSHEDPFMFIAAAAACALRGETLAVQSVLEVNVQLSLPRVFPFRFIELYSKQLKGKQLLTKFPTEGNTLHQLFIFKKCLLKWVKYQNACRNCTTTRHMCVLHFQEVSASKSWEWHKSDAHSKCVTTCCYIVQEKETAPRWMIEEKYGRWLLSPKHLSTGQARQTMEGGIRSPSV